MNNKNKMKRLAIISLIVMGIMLVFAMFDAARMNRKLQELQKTVGYAQLFDDLSFPDAATTESAETAESAVAVDFAPAINFVEGADGVQLTEDSYLPLALNEVQVYVPAKNFGAASSVTYRLGGSVAEAGEYRLALVNGKASDSIATFQNGEETVLSGARSVADGIYLTITAPLNEGQQSEQTEAIKQLLSDVTVSSVIPQITLFGETLSKDVAFETDGNYMQLQKGEDTVLVSEFKQTIDTSILEKTATLPNGLTLKYGNISDSKTGYGCEMILDSDLRIPEINGILKHVNPNGAVAAKMRSAREIREAGPEGLRKAQEEMEEVYKNINILLHEVGTRDAILDAQNVHKDEAKMFDCGWLNWVPTPGTELAHKFDLLRDSGKGRIFMDIDMPIADQSVTVQSYGGNLVRQLVKDTFGYDISYYRHLD